MFLNVYFGITFFTTVVKIKPYDHKIIKLSSTRSIKVDNEKLLLLQNDHRKVALGTEFHVRIRAVQPRGGRFAWE